jgi:hypothetical protein
MQALDVIDERRRPRQSSFGALSAGLIERGTVPAEVLYGGVEPAEPDAGDATEARSDIIAAAERLLAERAEFPAIIAPQDTALLQAQAEAERTRPLQSSFGSLSAGMVERGKLPELLNAAQIALLLRPDTVEMEELLSRGDPQQGGDEPHAAEPADADDAEAAQAGSAGSWARSGFIFPPTPSGPQVDGPSGTPVVAAPRSSEPLAAITSALYLPVHRDIDAEPDDGLAAEPTGAAPKPRRWMSIWKTSLLVTAVWGWMMLGLPEPPVPVPSDPVVDGAADAPAEMPTVAAEPDTALPVVAGDAPAPAPPTIEATEDQPDATPTAPWEFPRQRPGAVLDEPTLPIMIAPLLCANARLCAGDNR